jgi:prepilin-type processing-associated H-X9-DG protein
LYCPAEYDSGRTPATSFATSLPVGQGVAFYRSNLSYFIGIDADDSRPQMFLYGDHAMGVGQAANNNAATTGWPGIYAPNTPLGTATNGGAAWLDNSQHGKKGNIALSDGHVLGFSISELRTGLKNTADVNNNRLLFP